MLNNQNEAKIKLPSDLCNLFWENFGSFYVKVSSLHLLRENMIVEIHLVSAIYLQIAVQLLDSTILRRGR